jgi:hypothetical protein
VDHEARSRIACSPPPEVTLLGIDGCRWPYFGRRLHGEVGVEENTSKAYAADANLAAATLMNAAGAGSSLFVINLSASMAPLVQVAKSLPGFESYRLYQVARREDGRTRYRLRLGFFTSEADADAVLNSVRDSYPTAFTACLCDEDKKFARGYVVDPIKPNIAVVAENKAPVTPIASPAASAPKSVAQPSPKPIVGKAAAPKPAVAVTKSATSDTAIHKALKPTPAPTPKPVATEAKAATVQKPSSAPKRAAEDSVEIELSWDPPTLQTPPPATMNASAAQTIAPSFKTQDVIKASPSVARPKAPEQPARAAAAPKAPGKPVVEPKVASKPVVEQKNALAKQTIEAPSKLLASIELTLEKEPAAARTPSQASAPSSEPFRVGRGVEIPATSLTLESAASAPPATPAPPKPHAPIQPKAPPAPTSDVSKMKAAHAAAAPAGIKQAATPAALKPGAKLPDLDSTQTIRALTNDELADESQEKWFSIQLAVSEQPVNLDAMPRLDIFEAYRLYSVASAGSGKITHSLRIGFFREEVSAEAVSGYLKTFFNSPTVVRISIAEHTRFKDPPAKPAAKEAKVLDLSQARDRAPKTIPTVTMEVETPRFDPNATGSFRASATGVHKALSTGSHKALNATGAHRALGATGTHKTLKAASKASPPATKRSAPLAKNATGKHKALAKKSLSEQLLEEAREVELSESGIRKLPKNDSLLSKMFGKLTK